MAGIECAGCFDNCGGRVVPAPLPGLAVDRGASKKDKGLVERFPQTVCTAPKWIRQEIPGFRDFDSIGDGIAVCGDEDRDDRNCVARLMKVFEIERVIQDLLLRLT